MEFWEDLSGGVKLAIGVGLFLAIVLGAYNACSRPSQEDIRANEAKRSVT